ncbi:MAG TPA: PEGA domain-containing protein [Paludibacter sp.]
MKKSTRIISLLLAVVIFFASCSSSTMIVSNPPNAKLYLDGELVGQTPYKHTDSKIVGTTTTVKIEKDGYKPLFTDITKNEEADVGAIIGGLLVWVPFLWTLKYKPTHSYVLDPINVDDNINSNTQQTQSTPKSKTEMLRELKQLLDEKIITTEEFEKEKAKVLEMNN